MSSLETLPLFAEEESYEPEPSLPEGLGGMGGRLILPAHRGLSLEAAQGELRGAAGAGAMCPCCGQHAQVYRRRLNAGMAYALALLLEEHRKVKGEAYHVRSLLLRHGFHTGDYCYLPHWKVLSRARANGGAPYTTGMFRLTRRGERFVRGEESLPAAVFLYGEQVLGFSAERVTIKEALGTRFSLKELGISS